MKSRARTWWLLAGAIVVTVAAAALVWPGQPEPVYQGRKLSQWLRDYAAATTQPALAETAGAVRHIGTNALPWLVRWFQYEPPAWHTQARRVLSPSSLTVWLRKRLLEPEQLALDADGGFEILGPAAGQAVADLARLASTSPSLPLRSRAIVALGYIGKDGLPVLIELLERGDVRAQTLAANSIIRTSERGVDITRAVPGLLLLDRKLRQRMGIFDFGLYVAALEFNPDFLVPALTNCLCHSNPLVRVEAARGLAHVGAKSASAEPALSRAFNDPDEAVRQAATNAVKQIAEAVLQHEKAGMSVNPTTGSSVTGQTGLPITGPPVKPVSGQ